MTPTITSRKRLLNRFQKGVTPERFAAGEPVRRPIPPADRMILALGGMQDAVYYDADQSVVAYARAGEQPSVVLDRYDAQGWLTSSVIALDDRFALLGANGALIGTSVSSGNDTVTYFAPDSRLVAVARVLNEFFVEYMDADGHRLDVALCGVNRVSVLTTSGSTKCQTITPTFLPRWLALEDAWQVIPLYE